MKLHCVPFAVHCIIFLGCGTSSAPQLDSKPLANASSAAAGDSVQLSVKTWKETEAMIESHKGKVVVVDLWSTWCEPCLEEFPGLVKLHQKHSGNVGCISVNLNYSGAKGETPEDSRTEVLKFLREQKADFQDILSSDPDTDVYKRLNLASIPAVLVYDKTGQMRKRFDNESDEYGKDGFKYDRHIAPFVQMLLSE